MHHHGPSRFVVQYWTHCHIYCLKSTLCRSKEIILLLCLIMFSRSLYSPGYLHSSSLPDWFWPQSAALMFISEMQLLLFLPFLFHNKVSISIDTGILIFLTWEKITIFYYPSFEKSIIIDHRKIQFGKDFRSPSVPNFCWKQDPYVRLSRALSSQTLNISSEGNFTTSLAT